MGQGKRQQKVAVERKRRKRRKTTCKVRLGP
jgi:hypothetical protein